ncbi:MAG: 50S ribosomal protein L22 [Verrucomicrobiota bacterium]
MEVRAIHKYARISPLKARDVAREIQGLPASVAIDVLTFTPRKAAQLLNKVLKSAVANAENNHELDGDSLIVKEAVVDSGPVLKRWKPRARGGASPIHKRTSHLKVVLSDEAPEAEERTSFDLSEAAQSAQASPPKPSKKAASKEPVAAETEESAN